MATVNLAPGRGEINKSSPGYETQSSLGGASLTHATMSFDT